ncbi:hypothetical protein BH18ACT10_BH18ACT10_13450 [soil metagenome]
MPDQGGLAREIQALDGKEGACGDARSGLRGCRLYLGCGPAQGVTLGGFDVGCEEVAVLGAG